jgi:hypothetical protein
MTGLAIAGLGVGPGVGVVLPDATASDTGLNSVMKFALIAAPVVALYVPTTE